MTSQLRRVRSPAGAGVTLVLANELVAKLANTFAVTTLAVLLAATLAASAAHASVMSLDNLRDWIVSSRPADPPDLAGELPVWPAWRGFCPGLGDYFVNVGREFRRLCGPQLEEKREAIVACRDTAPPIGEWTAAALLSQAGRCAGAGRGAVEVWGELAQCTLSAYVTASDMTAQQRQEWDTFLGGIGDLQSLLELGDLFEAGKLAQLRDVKTPRTLEEALALAELSQQALAEPGKRLEKIQKAPEQVSGLRAALETLPFFEEWRYQRLRYEALDLLETCRPDAARDSRTRAELAHFQRLQAARAAYTLAEEQLYCAAKENRFEIMTEGQQQQVLAGYHPTQPTIYQMKRQDLKAAELDHRLALDGYRDLLDDPELADDRFAEWEERSRRFTSETTELLEMARTCTEGCGATEAGCRFPLETVERVLRARAEDVCADALGSRARLLAWAQRADQVRTASNAYDLAFDQHAPRIESLLAECNVNGATFEVVDLQRALRDAELNGVAVEACWGDRLGALEGAVSSRRAELGGQVEEAEAQLAAGREAAGACRWDDAEAAAAAAYDLGASTGCAPEVPGLAELYARVDALTQDVTARRARDEARRGAIEARAGELLGKARADLELARGDGPEHCAAAARVRAAATELAGEDSQPLCPGSGDASRFVAEAERLAAVAEQAAARGADALDSLLATAEQAEAACDLGALAWAADQVAALPPVCARDTNALSADLRRRHQELSADRSSAREWLVAQRERLERASAGGGATEIDAILDDVRGFAPEGLPRSCYRDLLDGILARGGVAPSEVPRGAGAPRSGERDEPGVLDPGESDGRNDTGSDPGAGDAADAGEGEDPADAAGTGAGRGAVAPGSGSGGGWVIETGGEDDTVALPTTAQVAPAGGPGTAPVDPTAGLIRGAESAFEACDFVSAQVLAERVRELAPEHPWLAANGGRIAAAAEKQRLTANQLTIARTLVQQGRLEKARDALVEAARGAPGCMSAPVDTVAEAIQTSIRQKKEANRSALADGLGGLLSAIGQVAGVLAAAEGRGTTPVVAAPNAPASRGGGAAGEAASAGGAAGAGQPSCYYLPNAFHDDTSFRQAENPPVWVVQVGRGQGVTTYNVLPVDSRGTEQAIAYLRRTTGADYLGPYGSKAAAESVARSRCPNTVAVR